MFFIIALKNQGRELFSERTSFIMLSKMFFSSLFSFEAPLIYSSHSYRFWDTIPSDSRITVSTGKFKGNPWKLSLRSKDCILKWVLLQTSSSYWEYALNELMTVCCCFIICPISGTRLLLSLGLSATNPSKSSLHASIELIKLPSSLY